MMLTMVHFNQLQYKVDEIDPIKVNKNGRVCEDVIKVRNDGGICLVAGAGDPIGYKTTPSRTILSKYQIRGNVTRIFQMMVERLNTQSP